MEDPIRFPNVQLYKVNGSVKEPLLTAEWRIHKKGPSIVSQVGSVSWTLGSAVRCSKSPDQSYVFAVDPPSSLSYCLILPQGASDGDIARLEAALESFTSYEVKPETFRDKLIRRIDWVSKGTVNRMTGTANFVGDACIRQAEKFKQNTKACERPTVISDRTKRSMKLAHHASKTTAALASFVSVTSTAADLVLDKGMEHAVETAVEIAEAVEDVADEDDEDDEKVADEEDEDADDENKGKVDAFHQAYTMGNLVYRTKGAVDATGGLANAIGEVTRDAKGADEAADAIPETKHSDPPKPIRKPKGVFHALFIAGAEIYRGATQSMATISQKTADATKEVVTHKFGEDAGEVVGDGMATVYNGVSAVFQVAQLG